MKRFLLLSLLVGCTDHANIGTEPVKCKATASGAVNGTVENSVTGRSFSFGTPQASFMPTPGTTGNPNMVLLDDSNLGLDLIFQCPQSSIALGTYDAAGGQQGCPFSVLGSVSQAQQQLYATAVSGEVIVDQDTNCFAGRFDLTFGNRSPDAPPASGELSGWFSVPVQ
jgi:hypothetical protein